MKKLIISVPLAAFALVATPVAAQSATPAKSDINPALSSDEAWNAAIDAGTTDTQMLGRREIAPGIFPTRLEMRSLAERNCYVGGDVISSDPKIAKMMAAGLQCTDDFRKEVNKRKKAGSTTFYVHQTMIGYTIRIDKRGSSEQGNSTCDAVSPYGSVDPIAFACFNDMSGHQRVMGFAAALGQTVATGGVNFGLMRAQRPNQTVVDNRSGSAASSDADSNSTGGSGGTNIFNVSAVGNNAPITANAGAAASVNTPCDSCQTANPNPH